jgi:hypothetical protein
METPLYAQYVDAYDLHVIILRGTARVLAAVTGLLLVYGAVYALEGMTTRIPINAARELVGASLWTAPWMLLFCSGMEDLATVTRKNLVLWPGVFAILLFLYYLDRHTSLSFLTKAAMPPLAVGAGLVPHFVRRSKFLFALSSLAAGGAGAYVLYLVGNTALSPTTHFANRLIAVVIVTFGLAAAITGLLAVFDLSRKLSRRLYA